MTEAILNIIDGVLVVGGAVFVVLASVGLLRLPDLYSRMHAASKAGPVGAGLMLLALALNAETNGEALRGVAAILFLLLTAPIAAHLLARSAYTVGYGLWSGSVLDEMPEMPQDQRSESTAMTASGQGEMVRRNVKVQRRRPAWRWSELRRH